MENDSMRSADEASEAVRELGEALGRAGISLPSLGLDAVTLTADPPRPLVDLGRCTAATARLLAAALQGNTQDTQDTQDKNVNEGGRG